MIDSFERYIDKNILVILKKTIYVVMVINFVGMLSKVDHNNISEQIVNNKIRSINKNE